MKKHLLHPATFKLDGGAMFGIIPKPLWSKKIPADELNRIPMALRVVYLETKNRKILIDTGIGDYHHQKFKHQFAIEGKASPLEAILAQKLNVDAKEITDIIITHLHFDHVGGLGTGDNGDQLLFPNATIHISKKHFEYAQSATLRDQGSFQKHFFTPLLDQYIKKGQIHFLEDEQGVILNDEKDKIEYKTSFGHTPHMLHPIFDGYIYMADLVPTGHHIKLPWVMGYDIEPGTTTIYKERFYQYIIQEKLKMIFEHDCDHWGGTLTINEKKQYALAQKFSSDQTSSQLLSS